MYTRTPDQDETCGVVPAEENPASGEMIQFGETCPKCRKANCEANMKCTQVPNFGEVIIMATYCPSCGYRDAEARPGGAIALTALRLTLTVKRMDDLKRLVIKSDTASVQIPEIDLELTSGTLGGRLTTVEGLLRLVADDLSSVVAGDSTDTSLRTKLDTFCEKLDDLASGREFGYRLIIIDPAGRSHIEKLLEPVDPDLLMENFDRTVEQNEELGLNDMKVDDYEGQPCDNGEPNMKRSKASSRESTMD